MSPLKYSKKILSIFNKYFYVILGVIVLIVLASGYYLFIQNKVAEIQQVGTVDLESKQNTQAIISSNLTKLIELNDLHSQIQAGSLDKLSKILPSQSDLPFLMIELEEFVDNNELSLTTLDIGPLTGNGSEDDAAVTGAVKELNITLGISGIESYFQLKNFLQVMSEQLPLMELSSLNYNDESESYNLNLTTYYQ